MFSPEPDYGNPEVMNMNSITLAALTAAGLCLAGCANSSNNLTFDTVGPAPVSDQAPSPDTGSLLVYSAYEVNADFNNEDPYRHEYSNYRICTEDGKLLQFVKNDNGTPMGNPNTIHLPAGKYRVLAHANGRGTVSVPVIIENGRITAVHLENGVPKLEAAAAH